MKLRRLKCFIFLLFVSVFCSLVYSKSTLAASNINPVYGLRSYFYNQGGVYPTAEDGIYGGSESANTPFSIIGSVPSGSTFIALKRLIINTPVNIGDSSARFNNISVYYTFTQSPGSYEGKSWTTMYYQPQFSYRRNDGSTETKYCNISVDDRTTLQFHCSISLSDYKTIDYLTLVWGGTFESNQTFWRIGQIGYVPGSTNPNYDGDLILQSVSYDLESAQDPAISQNNTMIQQNQTIIEQNNRIAGDLEYQIQQNDREWNYISDTTPPSVNTDGLGNAVGWLPPGPVDSILTLPLQLLQGIINVFTGSASCTPLNFPVPFVNYNLQLPCVNVLMDQIGFTPIWSIVGGVISAIIIWQTLKWLYEYVDRTLTFRENNSGLWGGL